MDHMKCLNVIVLYDNAEEVIQYVEEVLDISDGKTDIILVVNKDSLSRAADIQERFGEGIQIVDFGQNVGYLNSLLKVIKEIDIEKYDFYILSNTDIHYQTIDFFQRLERINYDPEIGCIAPDVYNPTNNSHSNPHYLDRIPKKKMERLVRIFKHPFLGRVYLKLAKLKSNTAKSGKTASCYVYSPHGCYMIFTKSFIKAIQGYDYGVKLYSEESAIGELLLKNNYKCYYDEKISVIHNESSVTGKLPSKIRFSAWRESLEYILKEFY